MLLLVRYHHHPPLPLSPPTLSKFKTFKQANQLHAHFITTGLTNSPSLFTQITLSLLSSPHPPLHSLALRIFFSSSSFSISNNGDPFLWNAIIKSFSHGPSPFHAVLTFSLMLSNGFLPDKFSFSLALKACSRASCFREGTQIHSLVQKCELASNNYLQNALIALYSKCGRFEVARQLFDRIPDRDSVSWNSMIDGYVKSGELGVAKELFDVMPDEDKNLVTWNTIVGGYASNGDSGIDVARYLFDQMPVRDSVTWNSMIDGYAKCRRMDEAIDLFKKMPNKDVISWANLIAGYMEIGRIDSARWLFDEMPEKDVIAWNIMLAGYNKNGKFLETLHLFNEMMADGRLAPDSTTLATILSAISELGQLKDGITIHHYIARKNLSLNDKLGVGLIDMYSKCGRLADALHVFEISGRSVDHWNAMICGLAIHGYGKLAIKLFREMEKLSLYPDDITFIGVLSACSHAGLVHDGLFCFEIMQKKFNLVPKIQHYGCIVDILSRAGKLEEAWKLIEKMPIEPNEVIWRTLLSGCRKDGNFDMGMKVAKLLTEGSSFDSSLYILLANIYAGIGLWGDARKVRMRMRERELRKVPGCSWIELDGEMHEFVVGDSSKTYDEEAYSMLEKLSKFKLNTSQDLYSIQQR